MHRIIVGTTLFIGTFIVTAIAFAYGFYFVGMALSLATVGILGIEGELLASIFAWIGVGNVVVLALAIVIITSIKASSGGNEVKRVELSEEDFEEFLRELDEMGNKDDKEER